jgi:hypothetical protein
LDHLRGALAGEVNCTPKPDAATDLESCQGAVERTATDMIDRRQDPYPRIDPTFAPASSRIDGMLAAIGAAVPKRREMVHEYSRSGREIFCWSRSQHCPPRLCTRSRGPVRRWPSPKGSDSRHQVLLIGWSLALGKPLAFGYPRLDAPMPFPKSRSAWMIAGLSASRPTAAMFRAGSATECSDKPHTPVKICASARAPRKAQCRKRLCPSRDLGLAKQS